MKTYTSKPESVGRGKKVYISGPMAGVPENRVRYMFKEAENLLRMEGYVPVNPAVMLDNPGLAYEDYMYIDFAMIDICDGIHMLPNWKDSNGANREYEYATRQGKEVITLDYEI